MGKHQSLTLLMILCYADRQETSMAVLWEAPKSIWLRQMQSTTAKQWTLIGYTYIIRGRNAGPKGDKNSTVRPTESTNLDLWVSQRLSHQSGPRPLCTYVAYVQLVLYVCLEQLERWLFQKLLPVCGICSSWAALSGLSGRKCTLPCRDDVLEGKVTQEGPTHSNNKEMRNERKDCEMG